MTVIQDRPLLSAARFPLGWKTRNLTAFRKRPDSEIHNSCFAANYAFRDQGSRFSVLKNQGTLPGPDECFSLKLRNAYPLFAKLLGLEVSYPGLPAAQVNAQTRYGSVNYYRSHLEEVFYSNSIQPLPPLEGFCLTFFRDRDALRVRYELRNKSAAPVPLRLRWISTPDPGLDCYGAVEPPGFGFRNLHREATDYQAWAFVSAGPEDVVFCWDTQRFESAWVAREVPAHGTVAVEFDIAFGFGSTWQPGGRPTPDASVWDAAQRLEETYGHLPSLPAPFQEFEKLILRAAGTLNSLKCYDDMRTGQRVQTIHAGKGALANTYFWDGAFALLGLDLLQEYATACGMLDLLVGGIDADGVPADFIADAEYTKGYQQPILAWGINHLKPGNLPQGAADRWYPALGRYVRHWLAFGGRRGGALGWDDALRWQLRFPIAPEGERPWFETDWGASKPVEFRKPDTEAHLFLECLALAAMAQHRGAPEEAENWDRHAATLRAGIEPLFNAPEGFYQDFHVAEGRVSGLNTAAGFLPLYAGMVPRDRGRRICERYLLDRGRFRSPLPFPGLDLSHPAFRSGGVLQRAPGHPEWFTQQAYWIGRMWPHVSFWLLGALWRYGFEAEADQAAYDILDGLSRSDAIYECYDPLTGYGNGHPEFLWSSAAVLAIAYRRYAEGPIQTWVPEKAQASARKS